MDSVSRQKKSWGLRGCFGAVWESNPSTQIDDARLRWSGRVFDFTTLPAGASIYGTRLVDVCYQNLPYIADRQHRYVS